MILPLKKRNPVTTYKCSITRVPAPLPLPLPKPIHNTNQKNKNVITDEYRLGLHVKIHKAVGIDEPTRHPCVESRHYNVIYWVKPGEEIRTKVTKGLTPKWNQIDVILLDSLDDEVVLNVEVQRFNSVVDPGTSNGNVVIGRVRIPFPMVFNRRKVGSFPLLRRDGNGYKLEGAIYLSMRLQRIKDDFSFPDCLDDMFYEDDTYF